MEKINKKKFRTAVNGYNKEDVTDYIRELSKMINEAERDSKEEIEELKKQIADLENKLAAAEKTIEETGSAAKKEEAEAPRSIGRERRIQIAEETARAASTRRERDMIRVPSPPKQTEEKEEINPEPEKGTKDAGLPEDFDSYIENLRKSSEELLKEFDKKMGIGTDE